MGLGLVPPHLHLTQPHQEVQRTTTYMRVMCGCNMHNTYDLRLQLKLHTSAKKSASSATDDPRAVADVAVKTRHRFCIAEQSYFVVVLY